MMLLLHVKQSKTKLSKTAIHIIRKLDLVTFHMKDYLSDETSKIDVRNDDVKTKKIVAVFVSFLFALFVGRTHSIVRLQT